MNMQEILKTFEYCGISYELLDVGDGWTIAVTQHGGHIFGPFSEQYPEGLFWIPDSIRDKDSYKELIDNKIWNIGGDRVWIAPEIQFNIRDRSRYRESLDTPKTIDPGCFSMVRRQDAICLEQSLDLSGTSEENIFAEAWNLLQVRTGGVLFIPMYTPVKGTDHYAPAGDHEYPVERGICLKLTGDSQYKIAYKSAVLTGRFGYMKESDTEQSYLIVINYPNNPSAMYSEEPPQPELAGDTGYSIHIYNDDGKSGGFAEMECNMQTIGRPTGISRSVDRLTTWIFSGSKERLKEVARLLLGYEFPEI